MVEVAKSYNSVTASSKKIEIEKKAVVTEKENKERKKVWKNATKLLNATTATGDLFEMFRRFLGDGCATVRRCLGDF